MKPEAKLTAAVMRLLDEIKKSGEPIFYVKIAGGPRQKRGLPDLHITYCGWSVWLELKAPGEDATPLQSAMLHRIRAAGALATVVWSVSEVEKILKAIRSAERFVN